MELINIDRFNMDARRRERQGDPMANHRIEAPAGLAGVVAGRTRIGAVYGDEGRFEVRGVDPVALSREASFEEAWGLVLFGNRGEGKRIAAVAAEVRASLRLPSMPQVKAPHRGLAIGLGLLADHWALAPLLDLDSQARVDDAIRLGAAVPWLMAKTGAAPSEMIGASQAEAWLRALTGSRPSQADVAALEAYWILTMDHGFNNSTFTARTIASTGADIAAALSGGVAALSGPLHGGAPSRVHEMLASVSDAADVRAYVGRELAEGRRIMGFGHAVYRGEDPRSRRLREVARGLGHPLADKAVALEPVFLDALEAAKPGRGLVTNVEYYASVVLAAIGLSPRWFTATFTVARAIGWTAHIVEQAETGKLIRPVAAYEPPAPRRGVA